MKALQLHYTSCRRGLGGSAGFQTRAVTPGLALDDQREIERRGAYRPPRDLPPEPTPDEITQLFPSALRSYRLPSGHLALTRASYAGRDYTGRWGNFFAHTLVLAEGPPAELWPIDLYEWPGWQLRLAAEDDTEATPPELPVVTLDRSQAGESFRWPELQEFLRERSGRVERLANLGRALLLALETARPVVVRDTPNAGLYWSACLQKLLPPALAWPLSWSSYQDDSRTSAQVNATSGETDFVFTEAEARFRFYLFDGEDGLASELPAATDDYPAVAAGWLAHEPARLVAFFAFVERLQLPQPGVELEVACHLFQFTEDPAWPGLDGERLVAMLDLVDRRPADELRRELLTALLTSPYWRTAELGTWRSAALLELWRLVWQSFGWLGERPPAAEALLSAIPRAFLAQSGEAADGAVAALLACLPRQATIWVERVQEWARSVPARAVGSGLGEALEPASAELARAVRGGLEAAGGDAILLGEHRWQLERASDPVAAHERYKAEVLDALPAFGRRAGETAAAALLEVLPREKHAALAVRWVLAGHPDRAGKVHAERLLGLANEALSIDPRQKDDGLASKLGAEAARAKVPLNPDRPFVRWLLETFPAPSASLDSERLARLRAAVTTLRVEEYELLLERLLVPALEPLTSFPQHGAVVAALFRSADARCFEQAYRPFLGQRVRSPPAPAWLAALRFWLTSDAARGPLARLEPAATEALVGAVARFTPEELDRLERQLGRSIDFHRWERLRRQVEAKRNTWWRRLGTRLREALRRR
jgi:hypothetical protein